MQSFKFIDIGLALCIGLLTGCGLSEDKYATKISTAQCALYEECGYLQAYGDTVAASKQPSRS